MTFVRVSVRFFLFFFFKLIFSHITQKYSLHNKSLIVEVKGCVQVS